MRRTSAASTLALLLALPLAGCFKQKQHCTVMPDGSGKLTVTFGMKKDMVTMMESMAAGMGGEEAGGANEIKSMLNPSPDDLLKNSEGCVAFSEPKREEKDGFVTVSYTCWTDDINKVKVYDTMNSDGPGAGMGDDMEDEGAAPAAPAARKVAAAMVFKKDDAGYTLEWKTEGMGKMDEGMKEFSTEGKSEEEKAQAEMMKGMMKGMMEGLEVSIVVDMPGQASSPDGFFTTEGRTGTFRMTLDDMLDETKMKAMGERMKKLAGASPVLKCGKSEVSDDAVKAFREEMAKAKADWEKRLAAHRAGAAAAEAKKAGEAQPAPAGETK